MLEKVFDKKQPVSETQVSDVESSEVEFSGDKKQETRQNLKGKGKFYSRKTS